MILSWYSRQHSGNPGLGYKSLRVNTGAGFYANTAMGFGAGQALSSGVSNTAMGRHALALTGVSPQNVAIGDSAMGRAHLNWWCYSRRFSGT
ncbi:MAG: hypothetical protein IPP72_16615 [Chitinophagaceae bacterium]|nr:hypothetical protein [Chitinophagaceae bacterium]